MSFASQFAIYFVIWWLCLFLVLPFGARPQIEASEVVEGADSGAPANPFIRKKMLYTTLLACVVYGAFYFAFTRGFIDFENLPFFVKI